MSWIFDAVADALEGLVKMFSGVLGFDFRMFNTTFPFALTAYEMFQRIAVGLILVIAVIHLLPHFFPSDEQSKASPIRIAFSVLLAVGFVFFGNYLLEGIIDLCKYAYGAIANQDASSGFTIDVGFGVVGDAFARINVLLQLIALLMIGVSFIKLLLECVERYCILFMLIYASPLASATLASPQTTSIFKKYFSMFLSQCLLVVLNMWILKLAISGLSNAHNGGHNSAEIFISLLMTYSVLRIGAKLDNYLNQLGLNAAITGVGLAGELAGAGMAMAAMAGRGFGRSGAGGNALGGNASGGKGGGILGGFNKIGAAVEKYMPSPITALGSAGMKLGGAAASSLVNGTKNAMMTKGGLKAKRDAFLAAGKSSFSKAHHGARQDNVYYRAAFGRTKTKKFKEYMNGGHDGQTLTDEDRAYIASDAHAANICFDQATDFTKETPTDEANAVIGATMQGIGAGEAAPELNEAIDVLYGEITPTNSDFTMDQNGIKGSYDIDGKKRDFQIVNQSQYDNLAPEEQHAFSNSFESGTGARYHYRLTPGNKEKGGSSPSKPKPAPTPKSNEPK